MAERDLSVRWLAGELKMNEAGLGQILLGKRPLKETLASHIEYVLKAKRKQLVMYNVELPDGKCEEWVPGWQELSADEQNKVMLAVVRKGLEKLVESGEAALSEGDKAALRKFCEMVPHQSAPVTVGEVMPGPSEMPVPYVPAARGVQGPSC